MSRLNQNTVEPQAEQAWNGVTIEELKFMRASTLIRLEMQKEYLKKKTAEILPVGMSSSTGLVSSINKKLTFAQKAILFIKGAKLAGNVISLFRKSRKR